MFEKPSLVTRIVIGKSVGFFIGLVGFGSFELLVPEADWMLRWGVLLWYTTMGGIIGVVGVFNWHPVLKLPLPWWVRAPLVGAWMNFVLMFFSYDLMQAILIDIFRQTDVLTSPGWFVVEGAVVGFIIGFFATRFGGEGSETVHQHA
jgi:hypothetical protein